jgi:hypoxanthine phosphoribosyltransferase
MCAIRNTAAAAVNRKGTSAALATVASVAEEPPAFQAYCGTVPPRFVNRAELEVARLLDFYGVPWQYEPRSFILEQDEDGRVLEAATPDFYLPEQNLYLELTTMKQSLVTRKNRKIRKLRERYPDVRVKLFYRRDFERLAQKYGLGV